MSGNPQHTDGPERPGRDATTPAPATRAAAIAALAGMLAMSAVGFWVVREALTLGVTNALGIGPGMFPLVSGLVLALLGLIGAAIELVRIARHRPSEEHRSPAGLSLFEELGEHDQETGSEATGVPVGEPAADEGWAAVRWSRFWLAVACLAAFVICTNTLGFIISISGLAFALLAMVAGRPVIVSAAVALTTGLVIWWGFGELLEVRFPAPELPFLAVFRP